MTGHDVSDDVIAELLALPPGQFTQARNDAAKRLLADGQREAAAEIKRLPRPPVALWALNQLAREQPAPVETFLSAAEGLRQAHQSGGDIRAATPPQREAEARVVAAAAELARARGTSVTETVMRGLRQTLSAAAADAEVAAELRAGRLMREPSAPSLDELLGSLPQESPPRRSPASKAKAPPPDHGAERRALRERIAEAKAEATRARTEARTASDAARAAQREWERARKRAEQTQVRSDAAEERVRDLQERLENL